MSCLAESDQAAGTDSNTVLLEAAILPLQLAECVRAQVTQQVSHELFGCQLLQKRGLSSFSQVVSCW